MFSSIAAAAREVGRERLRDAARPERHRADPARAELGGELAAHRLQCVERHLQPADGELAHRLAVTAEQEDHAGSLLHHVPGRRAGGQELGADGRQDRAFVVRERHVDQRRPLDVAVGDEVERDVDAALGGDRVGVLVDRALVEGVDLRRLGRPTRLADPRSDLLQPQRVRPARKTFAPSSANAVATAVPIRPAPP